MHGWVQLKVLVKKVLVKPSSRFGLSLSKACVGAATVARQAHHERIEKPGSDPGFRMQEAREFRQADGLRTMAQRELFAAGVDDVALRDAQIVAG